MEVLYVNNLNEIINKDKIAICLGSFDGLHLGHLKLVNKLRNSHLKKALLTFNPHPLEIINKKKYLWLTKICDQVALLNDIDYLIVLRFNEEMKNQDSTDFINFLKNNNVCEVVCGFDFSFGKNGNGTLEQINDNFKLSVIDKYEIDNTKVSTTYIKQLLSVGNIKDANRYLGRFYKIQGKVIKGKQIGRTLGFRTANTEINDYFLPKCGVYLTNTIINGVNYKSMTNIGNNPTFGENGIISIETHILDFDSDIYGKNIEICFLDFIREEKKFNSKEELINELNNNLNYVRNNYDLLINCKKY